MQMCLGCLQVWVDVLTIYHTFLWSSLQGLELV